MKILYDKEMPKPIRQEIDKILCKWKWLVPGWCQRMYIRWIPRSDSYESAVTTTNYAYRWVSIQVKGEWVQDDKLQELDFVHEMIHIFTAPLADFARTEIKRLLPETEAPKYLGAVMDELTARHESFVQDLAWCLTQKHKV